jgi:cytoskeletal protein CcmA (bactofilin family)
LYEINFLMEGKMFKKLGATGVEEAAEVTIPKDAPPVAQIAAAHPRPELEKSRLIVGPNIKLKGVEITDCDTLVVEGRVEASMDSRVIQVADGGIFTGTVGVDRAEIRGRFEGEMTVRDRLVVHATGRVQGKVRYGRLAVEEGGEIIGDLEALPKRDAPAVVKSASANGDSSSNDGAGRPRREPFAHPNLGQQAAAQPAKNGQDAQPR